MLVTLMTDASLCHKTGAAGFGYWCASDRGKRAGALILMEKTGIADRSQIIQIAERLDFYKKGKLRVDTSPVFNSEAEFVKWHD